MKPVIMFTMESCPYCVKAREWMKEVFAEHPEYKRIQLTIIDEVEEPQIADKFDYWYVPTFYVGEKKMHEGAASPQIIKRVFAAAYRG